MKKFSRNSLGSLLSNKILSSIVLLFLCSAFASQASAAVIISEVYGAGNNANSLYNRDYVELYNNGNTSVNISTYSIQYNSSAATTAYTVCSLATATDTTIEPRTYYLIATQPVPGTITPGSANITPDFTCPTSINLAATAGKIALVSDSVALTGAAGCPTSGATVLDFVGYGTIAAGANQVNCYEGSGPAPVISATTSDQRLRGGSQDTNNNNTDFVAITPNPQNQLLAPTAAGVSVSGNVISETGKGIWRASVMLSGGSLKAPVYTTTDYEGNFNFADIPAGETYVLSVSVKGYKFDQTNILVNLSEDFNQAHFIGTPKTRVGGLK